jgi:hypothetical protein
MSKRIKSEQALEIEMGTNNPLVFSKPRKLPPGNTHSQGLSPDDLGRLKELEG